MKLPTVGELEIDRLGTPRFDSPLLAARPGLAEDHEPILLASTLAELRPSLSGDYRPPAFEPAGPRARVFFDSREVTAAIVTCGGLCPGLNNVIKAITLTLRESYGVSRVLGLRYGYLGLGQWREYPPLELDDAQVSNIQEWGGTILGSSRGSHEVGFMVDQLQALGVSMLFTIGGDGTLRGAEAISREVAERGAEIAVIGVPKTIDNDLHWIDRSFGFATAVAEAETSLDAAYAEATGTRHGIGLVKLMGRHAGFIAAHATLSNSDVDLCLVPEVPFVLDGDGGVMSLLEKTLRGQGYAVVVVAEGAGQDLLEATGVTDASGNQKLADIGRFLKAQFQSKLEDRGISPDIKYIDPSYTIRSRPANPFDSELCLILGQHAVHAAMLGRTNMMVGAWNGHFVHVPIPLAVLEKRLDRAGETWLRVLESTGQPATLGAG